MNCKNSLNSLLIAGRRAETGFNFFEHLLAFKQLTTVRLFDSDGQLAAQLSEAPLTLRFALFDRTQAVFNDISRRTVRAAVNLGADELFELCSKVDGHDTGL